MGIGEARHDVREGRLLPVPVHLRDAHYAGAKRLGHGEGYQYAHDARTRSPPRIIWASSASTIGRSTAGFERELAQRLEVLRPAGEGHQSG